MATTRAGIELLATGIPGFDLIARGGLPLNRATLVSGSAGTGKTIFAAQFLVEGIRAGEACVFVTLEESPEDLRANIRSFDWDIAGFEAAGQWLFVDGSALVAEDAPLVGDYDLGGLLVRIQAAVTRIGAKRVVIDAVSAVAIRFPDLARVREELLRITRALRAMGVTSIITGERHADYPADADGVAEFVVDNLIVLRHAQDDGQRRRTLEVAKMRGVAHRRGEFTFVLVTGRGIEVQVPSAVRLEHRSSTERSTFGNAELDRMCGGGLFRDSVTLVSGQTGVGKTLLATEFALGGARLGERCLFFCFEESHEQLFRNAAAWGHDMAPLEDAGLLQVVCEYPEAESLEDWLVRIKELMAEPRPQRIVLDTLTALKRIASEKTFRDFTLNLISCIKQARLTAFLTADIGPIFGADEATGQHLSTITDTIILMRYVELGSRMRRGLTVLKSRGSPHESEIREYTIDGSGLHIGAAFAQTQPVLSGSARAAGLMGDGLAGGKVDGQ